MKDLSQAEAITENSFKLTGIGIVVDLKHSENGLSKNTELISKKSGLTWTVIARVLFDHALREQRMFDSESTEYMRVSFKTVEDMQKSIDGIKEREEQGIYQYYLKPIGHDQKPQEREMLKINCP